MNNVNSPKLYLLKNIDGKFYNAREEQWYSNFIHANYERNLNVIKGYLNLAKFADCEIHTITEHDFQVALAGKTTNVVLAGSYFAEQLKELMFKLPTISQVNKNMYAKCKFALDLLEPFTKMYLDFIERKEDDTDEVRGHYQEYLHLMAKTEIYQTGEINAILKAYQINRESILGVTRKILSHNKK